MNRVFTSKKFPLLKSITFSRHYSVEKPPEVPELPHKEFMTAHLIKDKGLIFDKKPFKFTCEKGKAYMWCACGRSHNQPFCDGSHKNAAYGPRSPLKPVKFIPEETKDYWFCNCKQTNNRPFCDGTHKRPDIQEAIKS